MSTYVLVPGANHGGWWYQPVVERIEAAGHRAVAVTPRNLDPELPAGTPATLDEHVEQLAEVVAGVDPAEELILVGHSYGGCLLTAVADHDPSRVAALVYLDALLPEDGESCWDLVNDWERRWYGEGSRRTGAFVDPLPFFDDRARPHPLASLMQASRLTGAWREVETRIYVEALDWPDGSPLKTSADRARADDGIRLLQWDTTHNVLRDHTEEVVALVLELAR